MNLVQIQERLKDMPLKAVMMYANGMNPEVPPYLALGELYRQGNDVVGMVDAYQRAIEREVDTVEIDMHYADLLLFMDAASVNITEGAVRQTCDP